MISEQEKQLYLIIALSFYFLGWFILSRRKVKLTQNTFIGLAIVSLLLYSLPFIFKTDLPWRLKLAIEVGGVGILVIYTLLTWRFSKIFAPGKGKTPDPGADKVKDKHKRG